MILWFAVKPKLRILIVDDQGPVLLTYTLILQQQGYAVTSARTYVEAVTHLQKGHFDLLLCDLGLDGGRNGMEVIEIAQTCQSGLACVLLTGYGSSEMTEKAVQRGVAVLHKPIGVLDLLQALTSEASAHGVA